MKKTVVLSVMVSIALVLSVIDSKIQLLAATPNVKIGLANIVTIIVLYFFGWREALFVTIMRCILAWFFHGSFVALILSLTGGMASSLLMAVLFKGFPDYFSITGISVSGAVIHNIGQIAAASVIIQNPYIVSYLPYFLILGAVSGYCIGLLGNQICAGLKQNGV